MSKQTSLYSFFKREPNPQLISSTENENNDEENEDDCYEEIKEDKKTRFLFLRLDEYLKNEALKHLIEDPQNLLSTYMNLTEPAKTVVCSLFWSHPQWRDADELRQNIEAISKNMQYDMSELLKSLVDNKWITLFKTEGEHNMDFNTYVMLLKAKELTDICKDLKLKAENKKDAEDALKKYSRGKAISQFFIRVSGEHIDNSSRVLNILRSKIGVRYQLSSSARNRFDAFQFPEYLGKDYRKYSLEDFYNKEVAKKKFHLENKSVDNANIVFQNRDEFERYLEAQEIYKEYTSDESKRCAIIHKAYERYKSISDEDKTRFASLPTWLRRFTPAYVFLNIMEQSVEILKKEEPYHAVFILDLLIRQTVYKDDKKAEWYAEKAVLLHEHLKHPELAAKALRQGFEEDISEEAKDVMRSRAKLLAKLRNAEIDEELRQILRIYSSQEHMRDTLSEDYVYKTPVVDENGKSRKRVLFAIETTQGEKRLIVEKYCIYYYLNIIDNQEFTSGEHWEGKMITAMFFLLFWDIIYSKPERGHGIFLSRHQLYPLDLYTKEFYYNRQSAIDDHIQLIEESTDDAIVDMMKTRWDQSVKCEKWKSVKKDQVIAVARCLHARPLAAICRRLTSNSATGFPDLTLWNEDTEQIKFVEVKTTRDVLSVKQLQWLHYLKNHDIAVSVAWMKNEETREQLFI